MAEIVMPRLSDTMEEGTILRWLKGDGEHVARGEELVEIETDKATMIYESDQAGALQIVADAGATLAVGEVIARVGVTAGDSDQGPASGGPASEQTRTQTPAAGATAEPVAASQVQPNGAGAAAGERIKASPLARRIAGESGID